MTNAQNPAAGWYPDPQNPMSQRYWDGNIWTDATRPVMPPTPAAPSYGATSMPSVTPPYAAMPGVPVMGAGTGTVMGERPKNYLVWSILSTACCCLPLGILAIVNAAKVDSAWDRGDVTAANDHSAKAKKFAIVGAAIGGAFTAFIVVLQVLAAAAGY